MIFVHDQNLRSYEHLNFMNAQFSGTKNAFFHFEIRFSLNLTYKKKVRINIKFQNFNIYFNVYCLV